MPLSATTLANNLANLVPVNTETQAISNFATAYASYASNATANGIPIQAAIVTTAQSSMEAALVGMSTSAASAIVAGVTAFWGAVVAGAAASFTGATAITPPTGLASLAANLVTIFATNTSGSVTQSQAANNIANAIHTASLGGTATFPGGPPIVAPIL